MALLGGGAGDVAPGFLPAQPDEQVERGGEGGGVEGAAEPQPQRDVVGCICRCEQVQEEQALLGEGAVTAKSLIARIGKLGAALDQATAQEIANAAVFLASPASSFTTGSEVLVDGGLVAG